MALAVGTVSAAGVVWYIIKRPRATPEEIERRRRDHLASIGRITDGTITDTPRKDDWEEEQALAPAVIVYNYRIGGVTYECAQDVTPLADHVRDIRIDLPIQVRYDPHNPADSIVVAESWSGLRLSATHPHPLDSEHKNL